MAARRDTAPVAPTFAACALVLVALLLATQALTGGFAAWTFDDRRVLALQQGRLVAQPPDLVTARGDVLQPWSGAPGTPRATLVDFIYTACPGVCQALGSEFERMQAELDDGGTPPAVALLSISFDLERDDRDALAAYTRRHHADGTTWTVAAPRSADALHALLQDLQVIVVPDGQGGFVHNGAIHLLDAQGRLRGLFDYDAWPQALAAARRLAAEPLP
ncbi:MAG: SCO family protein [Piscinibacter sp.]|nr:SCO family protein [Piscinibacter sp.]